MQSTANPTLLIAAIGALSLAASAPGQIEPDWKIMTPANTGIPGDFIHTLHVDEQDRLWVAAYIPQWEQGGIARHEGNNVWTTVSNVDYPAIPSHFINDIIADANDVMWVGTDAGLMRYDPAIGPASIEVFDTSNTPMPGNQVMGVEIDPDGKIWLALNEIGGSAAGGLCRFDPVAGVWDAWTTANGLPSGAQWPGWDWVDSVAAQPDASGGFTIWFGSYEMGTATYKDGVFNWFGNTWPPADPMTPTGLPSQRPVDADGNMWIVLWAGLARRAPDGTYTIVGYPDGLDTEVARIWAASGGRAVLGTYMSTAYVWDDGWQFLGDWDGQWTIAFAEDSTGALWVGGIGGVAKYVDGAMTERYRLTNAGVVPMRRWMKRAAQGDIYITVEMLQKVLNKWLPRGLEMFGHELGGGTNVRFGLKPMKNGEAQQQYYDEVCKMLVDLNMRYVRERLPNLSLGEAEDLMHRVVEGDTVQGIRREDLLHAPHKDFFRRRGLSAFQMVGWQGDTFTDADEYKRHLAQHLPESYLANRDFSTYLQALTEVASGELEAQEAAGRMPILSRVAATCPCSKSVRWVVEDSNGSENVVTP